MVTIRAAAISASGSVTGSRERIRRPTGRSYWIEVPRSPRAARASQSMYWSASGRSSPIAWRSLASVSGFDSTPRISVAGSPGSTRTTTKTSAERKKRVATKAATLLRT